MTQYPDIKFDPKTGTFQVCGHQFRIESELSDTDYGPETSFCIKDEFGQVVQQGQEPASPKTLAEWFYFTIRENMDFWEQLEAKIQMQEKNFTRCVQKLRQNVIDYNTDDPISRHYGVSPYTPESNRRFERRQKEWMKECGFDSVEEIFREAERRGMNLAWFRKWFAC